MKSCAQKCVAIYLHIQFNIFLYLLVYVSVYCNCHIIIDFQIYRFNLSIGVYYAIYRFTRPYICMSTYLFYSFVRLCVLKSTY